MSVTTSCDDCAQVHHLQVRLHDKLDGSSLAQAFQNVLGPPAIPNVYNHVTFVENRKDALGSKFSEIGILAFPFMLPSGSTHTLLIRMDHFSDPVGPKSPKHTTSLDWQLRHGDQP